MAKYDITDVPDTLHAFQDHSGRFSLDQLLRKHGFSVVSRPKAGPAVWRKNNEEYTFKRALKSLPQELVRDAKYREDTYHGGM